MEICPRCKSKALESRSIRYSQEFEGNFYIIENVPARVCTQCGEILLSETTAGKIQQITWSGAAPDRTENVPVYEVA